MVITSTVWTDPPEGRTIAYSTLKIVICSGGY